MRSVQENLTMIVEVLIAKGKKQGFVTYEEIIQFFPDLDDHLDDVDSLCLSLTELGIEIVSAASLAGMLANVQPEPTSEPPAPRRPQRAKTLEGLFALYMTEIRQIPLLKPEEERELAKVIQKGIKASERLKKDSLSDQDKARLETEVRKGEQVKRKFIEANLRLVASIAWRYKDRGIPMLDLVQEGNIGLIKAVEKFDYRLGYRFSTYATWWIRQSITRAIADQGSIIRLPVHVQETYRKVEQAAEELRRRLGKRPTREQLARFCEMSQKRLVRLLDTLPKVCSLDALLCCSDFPLMRNGAGTGFIQRRPCPIREFAELCHHLISEDDDFELPPCLVKQEEPGYEDLIGDVDYSLLGISGDAYSPQQAVVEKALRERIEEVLSTLSERQKTVIELRFGLQDGDERTLEHIGHQFGLTRERIRQIEGRALTRLRQPIRTRKLAPFWISE